MAAIIGTCLMESGVRFGLRSIPFLLGEKRAPEALAGSSFRGYRYFLTLFSI